MEPTTPPEEAPSLRLVIFCCALAVLGCGLPQTSQPKNTPDLASAEPTSAPVMSPPELMKAGDLPGMAVAVVTEGEAECSYYGKATVPTDPVVETTLFEAASLTKPVVAYLVLRLVDHGRLALDEPLTRWGAKLPLPEDDPRSSVVTLRMALAHSTGLAGNDSARLQFREDPGTTFRYFPAGYRLAQRVVEHVEGAPLEEVAAREVFGLLGMKSSALVWRPEFAPHIASRHNALGAPIEREWEADRPANAAASLLTTAEDYGRFLAAVLTGDGLTEESSREMLTPQIEVAETDGGIAWGLGWGLEVQQGRFFHYGDNGAAKAFAIGSVDEHKALAYFANSTYGLSIAREMAQSIFPGEQAAVDWLGYAAWDSPVRLSRRDVLRAFVDEGPEAGVTAIEDSAAKYPELNAQSVANWVAWGLDTRGRHAERAALIGWRIRDGGPNAQLLGDRAWSLQQAEQYDEAIAALESALELAEDGDRPILEGRLGWLRDTQRDGSEEDSLSPQDLAAFAGSYGERKVEFDAEGLWYRRGDRPRYRLRRMFGTTFALEGVDSFRIRFETSDGKQKIIGLYLDGRTDESIKE